MKLALFSPYFSPANNGLAHYSTLFAQYLDQSDHDLGIICNEGYGGEGPYPIFHREKVWKFSSFLRLGLSLYKQRKNWDTLLLQFVPHMYGAKAGIAPSLAIFCLVFRIFTQKKIHVMFHELHHPFRYTLKDSFLCIIHHFMFIGCLWSSHRSFFSTHAFLKIGRRFSIHEQCFWLPVGSNMPIDRSLPFQEATRIVFFGSLHASKRVDLLLELAAIFNQKDLGQYSFEFIGIEKGDLEAMFPDVLLPSNLVFHGVLPDKNVSEIIGRANIMFAYFVDGLSARRGSVLAALASGVPVISTKSWGTDPIFANFPGIHLFNIEAEVLDGAFIEWAAEIIEKEAKDPRNRVYSDLIAREYDINFSWRGIMARYMKLS